MNQVSVLVAAAAMVFATASASAATLYHNGPVVNAQGLSVIANGGTLLGAGAQTVNGNVMADNFTVGAGSTWSVESLNFYGYQTGATAFPFTAATWQVLSGSISGPVVASGTTSLTNSGLIGYRVSPTTLSDTARAIWSASANVTDFSLGAGNYMLTWSLAGSTAFSGPWQPPTSDGAVGNAMQSTAGGAFAPLVDAGNTLTMELPFTINGTITVVPEPGTLGMLLAGGLIVAGVARRRSAR